MPTTTYELGVSGTSFTGAANREDLLDVITIDPDQGCDATI